MKLLTIFLSFLVTFAVSTSKTPICTNGFTLINNKCLKLFPNAVTHKAAESTCMDNGATLVTVKNSNDNQAIATIAGSTPLVWIGLYCFDSDESKCYWDDASGTAGKYDNFASGFPLIEIGKCVYYSAKGALSGQWLSGACEEDLHAFICELPYTFADTCDRNYNGNCYTFHASPVAFIQAQKTCEQECGDLVSISSELENRYIALSTKHWGNGGIYIGATWPTSGQLTWIDGTRFDYNNFDYDSTRHSCVGLMNGNIYKSASGYWFSANCTQEFPFVCKRAAGSKCDKPTVTVIPTFSNPSYCNASMILTPGIITSPNFPNNYDNNVYCTYQVSTIGSYNIALKFETFITEQNYDKVLVFDGDSTKNALLGTYSGYQGGVTVVSSGNTMTVVFITDGGTVAQGFSARLTSYAFGR